LQTLHSDAAAFPRAPARPDPAFWYRNAASCQTPACQRSLRFCRAALVSIPSREPPRAARDLRALRSGCCLPCRDGGS
jgi:hypothetical protein